MLDLGLRPHHHAAAAGFISLLHALVTVDNPSGRKIGSLDMLNQVGHFDIRIVDISANRVDRVGQVVRRHVGRHPDGDPRRAVDQQQRDLGRQHGRLRNRLVEIRTKLDGILFDIGHHLVGDLFHPGLRITHGSRTVAVDRTEVPLPVHQHIAHAPLLCHTHHRFVDRRVAVRVELTEHVADDSRRLTVRFVRIEIQFVTHVVQNPAVNGFHAVPHIRKRTGHDDRHRIIDVGRFHLLFDIDFDDSFACSFFCHDLSL